MVCGGLARFGAVWRGLARFGAGGRGWARVGAGWRGLARVGAGWRLSPVSVSCGSVSFRFNRLDGDNWAANSRKSELIKVNM